MSRASLLAVLLLFGSCDYAAPPELELASHSKNMRPDPQYRLSPPERHRLAPAFDPDALEALLAYYPDPAQREDVLKELLNLAHQVEQGEVQITGIRFLGDQEDIDGAVRAVAEESPFAGRREHPAESPR